MRQHTFHFDTVARRLAAVSLAVLTAAAGAFTAAPAFAHGNQIVPSGTTMRIRVETDIRSTNVQPGDEFKATVIAPFKSTEGMDAIPSGTVINGRVISVAAARGWGQPSGVTLKVDSLTSPLGSTVNVQADLVDQNGGPLVTVENLTRGTELALRINRQLTVPEAFYMTDDGPGDGNQGDDFFDSVATVQQAQTVLRDLGYYTGPIDGRLTQNTRLAVASFQRDQRLSATGFLDRQTVDRLGLVGDTGQEVSTVNVMSAHASTQNNQLIVHVIAQTPAANWQVFEDHFRQRDTLHVYIRGLRTTTSATPGTQKEVVVTLQPNEWQGLRRVVIHGSGRNIEITNDRFAEPTGMMTPEEAAALEAQIARLLNDYARQLGVRYDPRSGQLVMMRADYRQNEIELLFALNSLAASAKLYTQILRSTTDPDALKGATDLFVAQANSVEGALARLRSPRAANVARNWEPIRTTFEQIDNGDTDFNRQGVGYR